MWMLWVILLRKRDHDHFVLCFFPDHGSDYRIMTIYVETIASREHKVLGRIVGYHFTMSATFLDSCYSMAKPL